MIELKDAVAETFEADEVEFTDFANQVSRQFCNFPTMHLCYFVIID